MEKELFTALIQACTIMSTSVDRNDVNNHPLWPKIQATIEKYAPIIGKVDTEYNSQTSSKKHL